MDSSVTSTYRHLADKVYKNPGTNVFGLFYPPIYNKVGFAYINSSLKFEIMAKQLYVASQRVL